MVGIVPESTGDGELSWKGAAPSPVRAGEAVMVEMCPTVQPKPRIRTCNRHEDCDAADSKARARGALFADHCDDDCCEDCFGT